MNEPEQLRIIPKREPADILRRAFDEYKPLKAYVLFSGGKDSSVTLDYLWRYHRDLIDGALHINTGIGIPQTREFAREFCEHRGIPFTEIHTAENYEEIVVAKGFPGPKAHRYMYSLLKERPLDKFVSSQLPRRGGKIALITGVRAEESVRRMGTCRDVQLSERRKRQLWIAPLIDWTTLDMWRYREQYGVPMSEPSKTIHLSGECLCGAFCDYPYERDLIRMFYPDTAARLDAIEAKVKAAGQNRCEWGNPQGEVADDIPGLMCMNCQLPLIESESAA